MRQKKWLRAGFAAALTLPMALVTWANPSVAAPNNGYSVEQSLQPADRVSAAKAPTSRLAQTDPTLLNRTESTRIPVLVKLDYDPVATYSGGVAGLAATSPTETGRKLGRDTAVRAYEQHVARREQEIVTGLTKAVPSADVRQRLRTVYGGVSATVPANKVGDLLKVDGVVAVQKDQLRQPLTDASAAFIGATSTYGALGGKKNAGAGIIFGVIDTGAWPEHPSFADNGNLNPPPAKADGTPRECDFGDNPLTPQTDVFACNKKLIGGAAFLDTYLALNDGEDYESARDSGGHGTHTASTAAGNVLGSAPVFGVERGPIQGMAPGAWISVYKGLGEQGGYDSDLAAAIGQAVLDGVDVINYSISGGASPFTDPAELAFLDAYAAGVFVAASAGNSGPGSATTDHVSPWVTTVAASTQTREFNSSLTLTSGGDTLTLKGASITAGVTAQTPVVLAESVSGYPALCSEPAPAGGFTGKIVACQRGVNARVDKGYNVLQGGAVGMVLYNPTLADIETDNHWLPSVHLADGTQFTAFMTGHTGVTGTFTAGQKENGQADVMAAFSSRGPGGFGIKPDITAPGVQILAGNSPTPDAVELGPPGEYFQAIAGTSMSAPHIAGAAVLLKALHPGWSPGQIKSAMMTTAYQDVVKEDLTTPADPFDYGSGRVDLKKAQKPGLTFDETAERMLAIGNDPVNAVHLNLPSVNAPVMPGRLTTVRTAKNVTSGSQTYRAHVKAPAGSKITVTPSVFTLGAGKSKDLTITITSKASGQQFGQVILDPVQSDLPTLHLPVAFVPQQGDVTLASECAPADRLVFQSTAECTITATNESFGDAVVDFQTTLNENLKFSGVDGATIVAPRRVVKNDVPLAGAEPSVPSLDPGTIAGYLPLADFGVAPTPIGDEEVLNFNVPPFVYGGQTYTRIGIDSNGYAVVGGGTSEDNNCCELTQIPDPARPNNVLAPFWTDLDGSSDEGIRATVLTDGVNRWLVAEWQVDVWGTNSNRHFQIWIGLNGEQDIVFAYDPAALPGAPTGQDLIVGAENSNGSGGEQLPAGTLPTEDLRITSSPPTPGASVSYTVQVTGVGLGKGVVTTEMTATTVPGVTVVSSELAVRLRPGGIVQ
ncbi:S8 family serine peptidase [Phytohabitans sp. ZYX-F-186]|uniref:S8 family serine peptidase n=1 Tax=Phytohabitans maris TaxID=3071409 RepID=A0ABU0ZN99_9ACTN|nr:S8 family serine peptidase [Phytohabitans sp. ZYX-F-186]MDQ7908509.1 S8 family serine peptidase [Phytohabitans sp. ZYX-F-186]